MRRAWRLIRMSLGAGLLMCGPWGAGTSSLLAAGKVADWSQEDTAMANQYLRLLEQKPEFGRVLDLLWEHYARHGETPLLLEFYGERAEAAGASPEIRLIHAHLLRKKGQLERASALYDALAGEPSVRPIALQGLADLAMQRMKTGEIERRLTELSREEGIGDEVLRGALEALADYHIEQSRSDDAVAVWGRLLERFPEDQSLREMVAARMIAAGLPDQAIEIYESIREHPDPETRVAVLQELGRLYELADRFSKAAEALNEGRKATHFRHHRHETFLSMLVRLYERQDKLKELENRFRLDAGGPKAGEAELYTLVRFYDLTAAPLEREQWLQRLVTAAPGRPEYRRELVEVLLGNDHYEEAKKVVESLLASGAEEDLALRLLRSRIDLNLEGREAASALLGAYLAGRELTDQEAGDVLRFAEENYLDEIAEELLEKQSGTLGQTPVFGLANLHFSRGRLSKAQEVLDDFVKQAGDDPVLKAERLYLITAPLYEMRLADAAMEALQQAVRLRPGDRNYLIRLAELQAEAKRIDEALKNFEMAWQLSESEEDRADIDQRIFSLLQLADLETGALKSDMGMPGPGMLSFPQAPPGLVPPPPPPAGGGGPGAVAPGADGDPGQSRLLRYYAALRDAALEDPASGLQLRAAWWAYRIPVPDYATAYKFLQEFKNAHPSDLAAERLLLEVAIASDNKLLALRQLDLLAKSDEERKTEYQLRKAEIRLEMQYEQEALEVFENIAASDEATPDLLERLARVYEKLGRPEEALRIYRRAFEEGSVVEKRRFISEMTRLQVQLGELDAALDALTDLIRSESDILQRRKELLVQVALGVRTQRLEKLKHDYEKLGRKDPLEPFYAEALSRILQSLGEHSAAFAAIKKAYYSSRSKDGYLLERMRELAAESKDVNAAIYYQKQLVAVPDNRADVSEWHKLIRMLETDFQVEEADDIRLRLESKFAHDPEVLKDLADYYLDTRQPPAARRVLQRMVRLRPWDASSMLTLGMLHQESGNEDAAARLFYQVLKRTREEAKHRADADNELAVSPSFPLRGFSGHSRPELTNEIKSLEALAQALEEMRILDNRARVHITRFLESPRPEFQAVPDKPEILRLRAIEELGALVSASAGPERKLEWDAFWKATPSASREEELWAAWSSGDWDRCWKLLGGMLTFPDEFPEDGQYGPSEFLYCLYGTRMHRVPELLAWVRDPGVSAETQQRRFHWLLTSVYVVSRENPLPDGQLEGIFACDLLNRTLVQHLISLLTFSQRVPEALRFGELAREHGSILEEQDDYLLATLAYRIGDRRRQLRYLESAVNHLDPRSTQFQDAVTALHGLQENDDDRGRLLVLAFARLAEARQGTHAELTRARLLSLAGDRAGAELALDALVSLHLDQAKLIVPASSDGAGGSLWLTRLEFSELARHLGLAEEARRPFARAFSRYELVTPRLAEVAVQFQQFFHQSLPWEFENRSWPERRALLRTRQSLVLSGEQWENLARALAAQNYHRDTIPIFEDLLERNPTDNDHLRDFLNACERANDYEPALLYLDKLFSRQVQLPENAVDESLFRKHAYFLWLARDVERLRFEAGRASTAGANASPESRVYHHHLATLLFEAGDPAAAARIYSDIDDGRYTYVPLLRRHAETLEDLDRPDAAIKLLERVELNRSSPPTETGVIKDLAPLYAAAGEMEKLKSLAIASLDYQADDLTLHISEVLASAGLRGEAQSLLQLAVRRSTEDLSRLTLLAALLQLGSGNGSFDAMEPYMETFFASNLAGAIEAQRKVIELVRSATGENALRWERFLETQEQSARNSLFASVCRLERILASGGEQSADTGDLATIVNTIDSPRDASRDHLSSAIEICLHHGRPEMAARFLDRLLAMPAEALESAKLAVRVYAAQGDEGGLARVLQEVLDDRFAAAELRTGVAEAFAESGDTGRALRIYRHYYDQIPRLTRAHRDFAQQFAGALIEAGEFHEAEGVLQRLFQKNLDGDETLIVNLYRRWNKLDTLEDHLKKFYLASGVRKKVEFLAARDEEEP